MLYWQNSLEMSNSREPLPSLGPREILRCDFTRAWMPGLWGGVKTARRAPVQSWDHGARGQFMREHPYRRCRKGNKYRGDFSPFQPLPLCLVNGTYQNQESKGSWGMLLLATQRGQRQGIGLRAKRCMSSTGNMKNADFLSVETDNISAFVF